MITVPPLYLQQLLLQALRVVRLCSIHQALARILSPTTTTMAIVKTLKPPTISMTFIAPENGQYLLWTWPKKNYGRWKIPVIGGDNSVRVWIQIDFMLDSGSWDWILHEARESLIKRADRLSSSSVWNKETHFKISGESSSQNVQARIILGNKWAGLLSCECHHDTQRLSWII